MNRVYYGKIGGGKTFCVMFQEIIPALRNGRKVITNIDSLDIRELRNYIGKDIDITVRQSIKWWRSSLTCDIADDGLEGKAVMNPALIEGALYVIDEAQFIWDAREFKDTKSGFLHLLEYNRHFGIDLVFITQNVKRCDVNISRLANDSYQIKNLGFLHGFARNRFVVNRRQTPFDKDVISQYTRKYDSNIFTLYKSGVDANAEKQRSKFSAYVVVPFLLLFIFSVVMLVKQGNPIAAISKQQKVVKDVNNSDSILGIPIFTSDKNSSSVANKSSNPVSAANTELKIKRYSLTDLDERCESLGYVKNETIEMRYYECPEISVITRNGVVDKLFRRKAVSVSFEPVQSLPASSGAVIAPSASPALAEGGRSKGFSGDLVYIPTSQTLLKKNE